MSQNPLDGIKRRQTRTPDTFPNPRYQEHVLRPEETWALTALGSACLETWLAHALTLVETRVIGPEVGALAAHSLSGDRALMPATLPTHPLAAIDDLIGAIGDGALRLGIARDEVVATAARMIVREQVVAVVEAIGDVRRAVIGASLQHLTTMVVVRSNGQSVQPTSLGHYLSTMLGPLTRDVERLRHAFARTNCAPVGAAAGVSTALPIRRERTAALLGFSGLVDHTLDAISAVDWIDELAGILASLGRMLDWFVSSIAAWARDDIGIVVPGAGFVHPATGQPQRRDPRILEFLALRSSEMRSLPARLDGLLAGIGDAANARRVEAVRLLSEGLDDAATTLALFGEVVTTLEVDRAMAANRTNRGFSTSSDLADLFAVDHKLPVNQAQELAEAVVAEALRSGLDATTIRTELIDRIALQMIGRELGIEPETLSRCLSPKRFIERRNVRGGPAPAAMSELLDRETALVELDRDWVAATRRSIDAARQALRIRTAELASEHRGVDAR